MWAVNNIAPVNMPMPFLFLLGLLCDIISLTSPKITQAIHLLLDFAKMESLFSNPGISIF